MGSLGFEGGGRCLLFQCALLCLSLMIEFAAGNVMLIGKNASLSFNDIEANFAPAIKGSGESGVLYKAEPLDACNPLENMVVEGPNSPFVLIIRGGCTFDDKVRNAQRAGFKAAIVYDNEDSGVLVAMAGTSRGINIHAVFVSKASGEVLKKYAGCTDVELWIVPTFENSAWSIMALSFISLLAMSAVLATCFFVRRHHIRRQQPRALNTREFQGMSSRLVKAMPSVLFTTVLEDNCTSRMCAICLEDYIVGEKLRILPCRHKFHALCVDAWLTTWRTFCPVCKQDARASTANPPASECTPLLSLSSASASFSGSTAALSSFHSSVAASPFPGILIMPTPPLSSLTSRTHSLSSIPCMPNPRRSYNNSPAISISRSSLDLRNTSSQISHPHLVSPHSLGLSLSSPMNSRYMTLYIPSSSNASPSSLIGSSGWPSHLWRCNDSGASLSAQSLPEC